MSNKLTIEVPASASKTQLALEQAPDQVKQTSETSTISKLALEIPLPHPLQKAQLNPEELTNYSVSQQKSLFSSIKDRLLGIMDAIFRLFSNCSSNQTGTISVEHEDESHIDFSPIHDGQYKKGITITDRELAPLQSAVKCQQARDDAEKASNLANKKFQENAFARAGHKLAIYANLFAAEAALEFDDESAASHAISITIAAAILSQENTAHAFIAAAKAAEDPELLDKAIEEILSASGGANAGAVLRTVQALAKLNIELNIDAVVSYSNEKLSQSYNFFKAMEEDAPNYIRLNIFLELIANLYEEMSRNTTEFISE